MITWKEAIQKTAKANREFLTKEQFLIECISLYNKENGTDGTVPELLTFKILSLRELLQSHYPLELMK